MKEERTGYRTWDAPGDPTGRASPGRSGSEPVPCDLCGAPMLERHCRLVCLVCGYQRDCSDP